jgi:hypothetical protein
MYKNIIRVDDRKHSIVHTYNVDGASFLLYVVNYSNIQYVNVPSRGEFVFWNPLSNVNGLRYIS